MFRKTFFALTLVFAATGAAFATEVQPASQQDTTQLTVECEYPAQPGPHTVIYREWSDLAG